MDRNYFARMTSSWLGIHAWCIIYGLVDPRTGAIRYIGKSCSGVKRIREHFMPSHFHKNAHKANWIKSMLTEGFKFTKKTAVSFVTILEIHDTDPSRLAQAEIDAITHYRKISKLTNITDGGDGTLGRKTSEDAKEKIRQKLKTLWKNPTYFKKQKESIKENGHTEYNKLKSIAVKDQFGRVWKSTLEADRELGFSQGTVWSILQKQHRHAKGLIFKRIEDTTPFDLSGLPQWATKHIKHKPSGKIFKKSRDVVKFFGISPSVLSQLLSLNRTSRSGHSFEWVTPELDSKGIL